MYLINFSGVNKSDERFHINAMFKDKNDVRHFLLRKTTVVPSDGIGTTLNNVVYVVIYVFVCQIQLVKLFLIFSYGTLLQCSWVSKSVTPECFIFFSFSNNADRFVFFDINETHPLDKCDITVLFLAITKNHLPVSKMT